MLTANQTHFYPPVMHFSLARWTERRAGHASRSKPRRGLAKGGVPGTFDFLIEIKLLFRLSLLLGIILGHTAAAESDDFSAVRLADQQRMAATLAGDSAKLGTVLSDELSYMHSDGRVQTKAQFIAAASSNTTKYLSVEPSDLSLRAIVPGAVSMIGRAPLPDMAGTGRREFNLQFLAIWREEAGHWRLLLYQSTQLPGATAAAVTK